MILQMLSKIKCAQPLLKLSDGISLIKNNFGSRSLSSQINPAWRNVMPNSVQLAQPSTALINHISARNNSYSYRPNAAKRIRKHGLEKRLSSRSGREILFRRLIKGRNTLCVFPRFVNEFPDIKPSTKKRVNLFSKEEGYTTLVKKPEYYKFRE